MWFMVCHWPQSQGDWARPHLCKLARYGPWPARQRFIRDHVWRGRSKPGCWTVGSVTIVWLTTEGDDQSSLYCVIVSTDVIYVWKYWASRRKPWRWMLKDISIHKHALHWAGSTVLTVHILFAYCLIQIRPSVKIADWMILYFIKKFIGLPVFPAVYCGYQPPAWKSPHPTPNQPLCFARQTTSSPIWQQLCRQPLGRLAGENIHLTTKSSSKFLNRTNCKWRHKYVTNDDN